MTNTRYYYCNYCGYSFAVSRCGIKPVFKCKNCEQNADEVTPLEYKKIMKQKKLDV